MTEEMASVVEMLAANKLRNIHLLKMLSVYGEHVRVTCAGHASAYAVLVRLPVEVAGYDREHYPEARWIGVIGTNSRELAYEAIKHSLLKQDYIPGRWVYKCMDDAALIAMRRIGAIKRATAFISFTGSLEDHAQQGYVRTLRDPSPAFLEFIAGSGGYSREEVISFFQYADARGYWLGVGNDLHAACISFALHENIYEVSALYTRPEFRRRGYARQLVQAAASDFRKRQLTMRYQAREDNEASLRLAESSGLEEFLRVEHWITEAQLSAI